MKNTYWIQHDTASKNHSCTSTGRGQNYQQWLHELLQVKSLLLVKSPLDRPILAIFPFIASKFFIYSWQIWHSSLVQWSPIAGDVGRTQVYGITWGTSRIAKVTISSSNFWTIHFFLERQSFLQNDYKAWYLIIYIYIYIIVVINIYIYIWVWINTY